MGDRARGRDVPRPPRRRRVQAQPLGSPPPVPDGGTSKYRFLNTTNGSDPVTFSPCRPIHYVVRPDNAPPRGAKMIAAAVKRVAMATGLVFIDDRATDEVPSQERAVYQPDRYGDRWAPVLITWATSVEVPDLGVDIAGESGPYRVVSGDGTHTAHVSGTVALDPVKIDEIRTTMGEPVARAVIMHELGHLVGLAHTEHDDQLMFPRGNAGVTSTPTATAPAWPSSAEAPANPTSEPDPYPVGTRAGWPFYRSNLERRGWHPPDKNRSREASQPAQGTATLLARDRIVLLVGMFMKQSARH